MLSVSSRTSAARLTSRPQPAGTPLSPVQQPAALSLRLHRHTALGRKGGVRLPGVPALQLAVPKPPASAWATAGSKSRKRMARLRRVSRSGQACECDAAIRALDSGQVPGAGGDLRVRAGEAGGGHVRASQGDAASRRGRWAANPLGLAGEPVGPRRRAEWRASRPAASRASQAVSATHRGQPGMTRTGQASTTTARPP